MNAASLETDDNFSDEVATFGDRLEAARNAKGLTISSLAEKLAVTRSKVEGWEANVQEPRGNQLQIMAGMLNVSLIWLITGESNGTSDVAKTYQRPVIINDALGEIAQLKETLASVIGKLEMLEARLSTE